MYTVNDIIDLYEQVEHPTSYVVLKKVQDISNAFTENRFCCYYYPPNAYFMNKILLKELHDSQDCEESAGSENSSTLSYDCSRCFEGSAAVGPQAGGSTTEEKIWERGDRGSTSKENVRERGDTGGTTKEKVRELGDTGSTTKEKVKAHVDSNIEEREKDNKIDVSNQEFLAAVDRLNKCLEEENLNRIKCVARKEKVNEDEILISIGTHLLEKLSGNAYCSQTKQQIKCPCGCQANPLKTGNMFIGAENTWHGELDLLSGNQKNCCVAVSTTTDITVEEDSDDDEEGEDSPGDRTNVEVKQKIPGVQRSSIVQTLSQAIVFGWTEFNRHRNYSPYIPTVLIDRHKFLVVVYNPSKDSLMISSDYVPIITSTGAIEKAGIFTLWQILNHRLFFRKMISIDEIPCGFQEQMDSVEPYKALSIYRKTIKSFWDGIAFPKQTNLIRLDKNKRKRSFTE